MEQKIYQKLSTAIQARERCNQTNNTKWYEKWSKVIDNIMNTAPSGAGINCGTKLLEEKCTATKLVFFAECHHMTENGMYSGWTEHTITVIPTFVEIDIRINGRNRNQIKDYLFDVYYDWLTQSLSE